MYILQHILETFLSEITLTLDRQLDRVRPRLQVACVLLLGVIKYEHRNMINIFLDAA